MEFQLDIPVRFNDIDGAGIVYYPTFFHYCHLTFEEFFAATGVTPYPQLVAERRIGFPTVRVEGNFDAPIRYGDSLTVALSIPRVGNSSVDFQFQATTGAPERLRSAGSARVTKVCVDLDTLAPRAIPEDLRGHFENYRGSNP